jgi:type I restriction-modification system DNA methylase subunit
MKRHTIRDLHKGREVWRPLEKVISRGYSRDRVFHDWLDLMLAAHLSATDNRKRGSEKWDGVYEDRYMEIVRRYADDRPKGERVIDLFAQAYGELVKETAATESDVLGEIYQAMITFGEHGQFFTPAHISGMMAQMANIRDGERVLDPTCGSGIMLIEASKVNPRAQFYGFDLDPRCAKMCALNMVLFGLHAVVRWGDSLTNKFYCEWRISGGLIVERDIPEEKEKPQGQQQLFKAA